MSPVTHVMISWLAGSHLKLNRRERSLVAIAGIAPDIDGLGLVIDFVTKHTNSPTYFWGLYHHKLHNLWFALFVAVICCLVATTSRIKVGLIAFGLFHIHLLCDLAGSRGPDGYQWPIPYLYPFVETESLTWSHQWELNAWQNIVISIVAFILILHSARKYHRSPFELLSNKLDTTFINMVNRATRRLG
jgi:inner membrane protein